MLQFNAFGSELGTLPLPFTWANNTCSRFAKGIMVPTRGSDEHTDALVCPSYVSTCDNDIHTSLSWVLSLSHVYSSKYMRLMTLMHMYTWRKNQSRCTYPACVLAHHSCQPAFIGMMATADAQAECLNRLITCCKMVLWTLSQRKTIRTLGIQSSLCQFQMRTGLKTTSL